MTRSSALLLALGLALSVTACSNPADGKPKAKVEEAEAAEEAPAQVAAESSDAYSVDAASSSLGFVGSKVTGSHEGGFKTYTAEVTPGHDGVEGGRVMVSIDVGSMFTDAEDLTTHLKSADFFDAAKYPKATFESTEIKAGGEDGATHTVVGTLDLHGVKKKITFPATIVESDEKISVDSEFSIDRKDFDMKYAGKADDLIRDEVVIKLDFDFTS